MDQPPATLRYNRCSALYRELRSLLWNLYCGFRVMLLRGAAIERLVVSHDQLFLLLLVNTTLQFSLSYTLTTEPQFTPWGLGYIGLQLLASLLVGYLIVKTTGDPQRLPLFLVTVYSVSPFLYLVSELLVTHPAGWDATVQMAVMAWFAVLMFTIALVLLSRHWLKAAVVTLLWFLLSLPVAGMAPGFWYEQYDDGAEEVADNPIDEEKLIYSQRPLLEGTLAPLKQGQTGVVDLFFVGFGAYADQDVFMKEVEYIRRVADTTLGTNQRSAILINNEQTLEQIPLASSTNLGITLQQVGKLMNSEEDVLLLYLTSHGSSDHKLAVEMWPLGLNSITPADLKGHLDRAGIRWRIILVSACYSGGFVEPLQDEHTLILTAAAQDKSSFGCSHENDFTYFGEALFKQPLTAPFHFIPHFETAISAIEKREKREGLEPSQPQLHIGALMREKLAHLESEMTRYPQERFQKGVEAAPARP